MPSAVVKVEFLSRQKRVIDIVPGADAETIEPYIRSTLAKIKHKNVIMKVTHKDATVSTAHMSKNANGFGVTKSTGQLAYLTEDDDTYTIEVH